MLERKKGIKMPSKSVKKPTTKTTAKKTVAANAKKPAAKKAPAKATVKKTAPKKADVKKVVSPDVVQNNIPTPETNECKCGQNCECGADCKCARSGGSRFGRFMLKLIMILIVFALGFGAAKLLDCQNARCPRADFDNGCLDVSSVKCPRLQNALPAMDANGDGCITREEYRTVVRDLRRAAN